jgi:hypothetical protein
VSTTLTLSAVGGLAQMRVEAERKRLGLEPPVATPTPAPAPEPPPMPDDPPGPLPPEKEYSPWELEARTAANDLHIKLRERFPMTFRKIVVLKIGAHKDICDAFPQINPIHVGYYLARYCNSIAYLSASTEGALRFDLQGQPVGVVSGDDACGATMKLAWRLKSKAKRTGKA